MPNRIFVQTALLIIVVSFLNGCAFFPKNKVPNVGDISSLGTNLKEKPVIFLDYKRLAGKPNENARQLDVSQIENEYIFNILKNSRLFSEVIFDEYKKDKADFTVEIYAYEYQTNPGMGIIKAIITGASLMLIPTAYDFMYITNTRIIDKQGRMIYEYRNEDGITWWMGIFFLPFGDKGLNRDYVVSNLVKDSLSHLSNSIDYKLFISNNL